MKKYQNYTYAFSLFVATGLVFLISCSKEIDQIPVLSINKTLEDRADIKTPEDLANYVYFTVLRPNFRTHNIEVYKKSLGNSLFDIQIVQANSITFCSRNNRIFNNSANASDIVNIRAQKIATYWKLLYVKQEHLRSGSSFCAYYPSPSLGWERAYFPTTGNRPYPPPTGSSSLNYSFRW